MKATLVSGAVLLVIIVSIGCIQTQDGKIIIDLGETKEQGTEIISGNQIEKICKENVQIAMDEYAKKSPFKLKSPIVLEIKKFEDFNSADDYVDRFRHLGPYGTYLILDSGSLRRSYTLGGVSLTKKVDSPFYVAIARWDLETPHEITDRKFEVYVCHLNGSLVDIP